MGKWLQQESCFLISFFYSLSSSIFFFSFLFTLYFISLFPLPPYLSSHFSFSSPTFLNVLFDKNISMLLFLCKSKSQYHFHYIQVSEHACEILKNISYIEICDILLYQIHKFYCLQILDDFTLCPTRLASISVWGVNC